MSEITPAAAAALRWLVAYGRPLEEGRWPRYIIRGVVVGALLELKQAGLVAMRQSRGGPITITVTDAGTAAAPHVDPQGFVVDDVARSLWLRAPVEPMA